MTRPLIGLLVIGQSPRPDLEAEFRRVLGDAARVETLGALDGLDDAGIAALPPQDDGDTLYTTLPTGRSVLVSKAGVTARMGQRLEDLRAMNATVSILCCTGRFPTIEQPGVHFASDILAGAVDACIPRKGRIGVFVPSPAQVEAGKRRWASDIRETLCFPLSPDASDDEILAASEEMVRHTPDLIVHDCISYRKASRDLAATVHGQPALQAVSVCAHFAAELAGI